MSKLYKENGMISEEGQRVFKETIDAKIRMLLGQGETETEVRIIASLIHARVGDFALDKIQEFNKFEQMSDDEFDQYLKNQYGDNWMHMSLSWPELKRLRNYRGFADFVNKFNEVKKPANQPSVPISNLRYKG